MALYIFSQLYYLKLVLIQLKEKIFDPIITKNNDRTIKSEMKIKNKIIQTERVWKELNRFRFEGYLNNINNSLILIE